MSLSFQNPARQRGMPALGDLRRQRPLSLAGCRKAASPQPAQRRPVRQQPG